MAVLNLAFRCAYFVHELISNQDYWNIVLLVAPEVFSIGVVIA
jgi:hypothetical protein